MSAVKKEMGHGVSMGEVMSEISSRWKMMSDAGREPYLTMESEDRARYQRESAEADARAAEIQQSRRDKLVAQEGEHSSSRGARARIDKERAEEDKRRTRK